MSETIESFHLQPCLWIHREELESIPTWTHIAYVTRTLNIFLFHVMIARAWNSELWLIFYGFYRTFNNAFILYSIFYISTKNSHYFRRYCAPIYCSTLFYSLSYYVGLKPIIPMSWVQHMKLYRTETTARIKLSFLGLLTVLTAKKGLRSCLSIDSPFQRFICSRTIQASGLRCWTKWNAILRNR